jgi:transcriptional regulator with XRE-family HTH domain
MKKTLGQVVKRRRESLGLSQRELARRLGVKASHVGYLETARRRPSLSLLVRLAGVLGLEPQPLLLLAHPEAKGLLSRAETDWGSSRNHAWRAFSHDKSLLAHNKVTIRELRVLSQINTLGRVPSARHFLFVLNAIRQAVDEVLSRFVLRHWFSRWGGWSRLGSGWGNENRSGPEGRFPAEPQAGIA